MHRDNTFYNMLTYGLESIGFSGEGAFDAWVNTAFADKYNAKGYANLGFDVRPGFSSEYIQMEGMPNIYSLASYVDIDSNGVTKSLEGIKVTSGDLPVFKHELNLNRKMVEEQVALAQRLGKFDDAIAQTIINLSYNGVDSLLGGNYNTIKRQRHQIVSTGKLTINAANNPMGIAVEFDFLKPYAKNVVASKWYAVGGGGAVTQDTKVTNGTINPIQVMKDIKYNAETKDYAPAGHFEMSKNTWEILKNLDFFRTLYVTYARPDVTDAATKLAFGRLTPDETIKAFIESTVGAKIVVIDSISRVEKFDKASGTMNTYLPDFEDGVIAYVPDGMLGEIQFNKPLSLNSDATRVAYHDGGRTMLRFLFNDKTQTQTIESEVRGLVVPNKAHWMYLLKIV